jgi:Ca2+-binding EF-hand superfamily protein
MTSSSISRPILTLAFVLGALGCSHSVGEASTEQNQQAVAEEPAAPAEHDAHKAHRVRDPQKFVERVFQRFDKNGDGVLELAELPERKQKRLSGADTNNDGRLSADELAAFKPQKRHRAGSAHKRMAADPAKLIQKFDENGDGVLELSELSDHKGRRLAAADANQDGRLTVEELTAHREKMIAKFGERRRHGWGKGKFADPAKFIERFDKNADGKLELGELPERFAARIAAADTNGDKQLSAEELQTHFDARRAERRARRGGDADARPQ